MVFFTPTGSVSIPEGLYKRKKSGDKAKFIKQLLSGGYKGDVNEAWKLYTGVK